MNAKSSKTKRWEVLNKLKTKSLKLKTEKIVDILLKNRGIKTKKDRREFFNPIHPIKIKLKELEIKEKSIIKAVKRIKKAQKNREKIIVYGDYDADGICATAILWETLYSLKCDATPYIPERFSEGYGLNTKSIEKLKTENPKLKVIICVDNGITANKAVELARKLGIDVIIIDHHQKGKKLPRAYSIIHTDKISASAIAWILAREINKSIKYQVPSIKKDGGLELAAIGTIADQIPLIGPNRSFSKYGLEKLNTTERAGLKALFEEAGLQKGNIGTYAVGFIIAPRLNAMGRMKHALDSLRLLCIKSPTRARELAMHLGKTNLQRQRVVEKVLLHAKEIALQKSEKSILIVSHETYHEGVIGLAASKLVEEFWRPAIVLSKGKEISKASARSIPGFNIIEFIHKYDAYLEEGGGHPMAAGFKIRTSKISKLQNKMQEESAKIITQEMMTPRIKIDVEIAFNQINQQLYLSVKNFEPTGLGNPTPTFLTKKATLLDAKVVGSDGKHLRLKLENNGKVYKAICFGKGELFPKLTPEVKIDLVYSIEENVWNGNTNLELKAKDLRIND